MNNIINIAELNENIITLMKVAELSTLEMVGLLEAIKHDLLQDIRDFEN